MAIVVLDSDVLDSHPGITAYYVVGPITLKIKHVNNATLRSYEITLLLKGSSE